MKLSGTVLLFLAALVGSCAADNLKCEYIYIGIWMYVYKRMRRVVCARACVRGYAVIILRCARDDALYLLGVFPRMSGCELARTRPWPFVQSF